ncbi:MAG: fasciclin domain-containing protein [Cyanobacteria bacterium J06628_6]
MATIAGIVAQSGNGFDDNAQDFDILFSAVQTAGLVEALDDSAADLTVFAPTDAAFIALAQDLGFRGIDEAGAFDAIAGALTELGGGDPIPLLADILLYHVSPEAKSQTQIQAEGTLSTLLTDATFTLEGNELIDNEPDLLNPRLLEEVADVEAANGIVQGIDRVLIPLDIPGNSSRIITGSSGQDFLFGFLRDTLFFADEGDDFVIGGFGDDQLNGNEGDDVLFGSGGSDILRGDEGNDRLQGSSGNDLLIGGAGHDILRGGRGDDLIDGGAGEDTLYLSGGNDIAVLRLSSGPDTVFDFHPGEDRFALADGLSFASLGFQASQGFTTITAGEEAIAIVMDTAPASLSLEANFIIV